MIKDLKKIKKKFEFIDGYIDMDDRILIDMEENPPLDKTDPNVGMVMKKYFKSKIPSNFKIRK